MRKTLHEIVLTLGTHATPEEGLCLMEAEAYLAGHSHTDHDPQVCPTIGAMARGLNDCMNNDESRQRLKVFCGRLIGTNGGQDLSRQRSYMALDWLVREYLPTWLELVPALADHAAALRATATIVSAESAKSAQPLLAAAGDAAWDAAWDAARAAAWAAAGAAARAAAWAAAGDAAGDAAGAAAWAAAGDAAGDAAGAAAGAAARDAAGDAAGAAAGAAARDAAGDAAGDAARAARAAAWAAAGDAAGDAAGAAAWERLQPTVQHLQGSAIQLLDSMIEVKL